MWQWRWACSSRFPQSIEPGSDAGKSERDADQHDHNSEQELANALDRRDRADFARRACRRRSPDAPVCQDQCHECRADEQGAPRFQCRQVADPGTGEAWRDQHQRFEEQVEASTAARPPASIRRYGAVDLARIRFIKSAQRLGFSLDEVAELLKLDDGTRCNAARRLAERKLQDVRERLADLQRIESVLDQLVARCESARGSVKCPLISSLQLD